MKKILTLVILLLAIHFLAVAGSVAYLVGTGKLDKEKARQVAEILFPAPATQPAASTQPAENEAEKPIRPLLKLEELLAKQAGRPANEQVEFIRNTFDEQNAQLDRRYRELEDFQRQIESARDRLARDRAAHEARERALDARVAEAERLAQDEGFQKELSLYQSMPASQVKRVFAGMEDAQIARFLSAMTPRAASKIIKEFKTPEETARVQAIMERVRQSGGDAGGAVGAGQAGVGDVADAGARPRQAGNAPRAETAPGQGTTPAGGRTGAQ